MAKNTSAKSKSTVQNEKPIEAIFLNYRAMGFPYYTYSLEEKHKKLSQLINYTHSDILVDGTLRQTMHGLPVAWSYFPHACRLTIWIMPGKESKQCTANISIFTVSELQKVKQRSLPLTNVER